MVQLGEIKIQWMTADNISDICKITSLDEKTIREKTKAPNRVGVVCVRQTEVVGFAIYERNKSYVEVLEFFTKSKTASEELIKYLQDKLTDLVIGVKDSNLRLQLFLNDHGFVCDDIQSDRYVMKWRPSPKGA